MNKYGYYLAPQASSPLGEPMRYFGSITIATVGTEVKIDPHTVIQKTMDCFQSEVRKELERLDVLDDDEFCDKAHESFCEYMRFIFNHGWLREWRRNPEDYGKLD